MPLNRGNIYKKTLRNQQRMAQRRGWAEDDPRIERRAGKRADQRMAFRQGIQSGEIARPENRLQRNMAFRDFIGQKYNPEKMEARYNRRQGGQAPSPGSAAGGKGGQPSGPPGFAGGKGGSPSMPRGSVGGMRPDSRQFGGMR